MTRREAIRLLGVSGGVLGAAIAGGYLLPQVINALGRETVRSGGSMMDGGSMMGSSSMMGSVTQADMSTYMDMFNRHAAIRRTVEQIPGGIRTTTESDAPDLSTQLQAHVESMYSHLVRGTEVTCMSPSLSVLFANSSAYSRQLVLTEKGVAVTETSSDPYLTKAIRDHAQEVTGFVEDGMTAMMQSMISG
jgi:hypothetical protein